MKNEREYGSCCCVARATGEMAKTMCVLLYACRSSINYG